MTDTIPPASPLHALCVYAEPLVGGRRVAVLGDSSHQLAERFLEMGARVVHAYDPEPTRAGQHAQRAPRGVAVIALPLAGDFDVRDGAFDLVVIPDIGEIPSPAQLLSRVRRLLAPGGVVLVRARSVDAPAQGRGPARPSLDYYELYDLVALQFAHVRMVGQIAWTGVALAELGRGEGDPDVTVDTQLVTEPSPPEAFIALGSQEDVALAEYALVQVPPPPLADVEATIAYTSNRADLAAAQLRASLLETQVEELRAQRNHEAVSHSDAVGSVEAELAQRLGELQRAEGRVIDANTRAERALAEVRARDEELARIRDRATLGLREVEDERRARARAELDLVAARKALESAARDMETLSSAALRVPALEDAALRLAKSAEEQAERVATAEDARSRVEIALAAALVELDRTRRAGAEGDAEGDRALAVRVRELEGLVRALEADSFAMAETHARELTAMEEALRERARSADALMRELGRRETIVLDLVHALEEARLSAAGSHAEAGAEVGAAVEEARETVHRARGEAAALRKKLDEAALEIARREGESATAAWRIQELEQAVARLEDEQSELTMTIPPPSFLQVEREANDVTVLASRLAAAEDELDMVRRALSQEHEARVRAESGEALEKAHADISRQAALLEKLSRELEAHDGVRRTTSGDETVAPRV